MYIFLACIDRYLFKGGSRLALLVHFPKNVWLALTLPSKKLHHPKSRHYGKCILGTCSNKYRDEVLIVAEKGTCNVPGRKLCSTFIIIKEDF